jgi:hypothetical protein
MTAPAFPMLPAAADTPERSPAACGKTRIVIRRRASNNRLADACR